MKARAHALLLIAAVGPAAAQLRAPVDGTRIELPPLASTFGSSPERRALATDRTAWRSPATSSVSLVEMPNYGLTPERTRPSYALGFTSETMRNWMNDIGMDAGACTAPIIRLRTRVDANGDFRGTLWVHARCSIW